jgi:hypothetical protein
MNAATLPPESRSPATSRANRLLLLLLGLVLLAAGTAGLLAGLGGFGSRRADQPVLTEQVARFADRNTAWFWPVVAMVAVIIGLLALGWLLIQARTNRMSGLDLEADRSHGRTRLEADALTGAMTGEIESYRGVAGASARLHGDSVRPRLSVRVDLDGRVDPGEVRRRVESEALAHARSALSAERLPTRLELVVPKRPAVRPG